MRDELDVDDVSLTFRDGAVANVGDSDQAEMTVYDDRDFDILHGVADLQVIRV